jgi:hypothetical protein
MLNNSSGKLKEEKKVNSSYSFLSSAFVFTTCPFLLRISKEDNLVLSFLLDPGYFPGRGLKVYNLTKLKRF